jgi:hypothetical protein
MRPLPERIRRGAAVGGTVLAVLAAPVAAHEPLFGETPVIFGPNVYHPEVKIMYFDGGSTRRTGSERMRMIEQMVMVDYGVSRYLNLRLEAPYLNTRMEMNDGSRIQRATVSGLGDVTFRGKYRFILKQATGFQLQHSALLGVKLPTGENDHRYPNGERLDPIDQTGSGKFGLLVGYAFDRETIEDTVWASVRWTRDLGGGFRRGDWVELDAAYGRWLITANTAEELGIIVPLGLHAELAGSDRLEGGRSAENSYRLVGFQATAIATKGRHQFRIGVFIPAVHSGDEKRDYPYQARAAWETFF